MSGAGWQGEPLEGGGGDGRRPNRRGNVSRSVGWEFFLDYTYGLISVIYSE